MRKSPQHDTPDSKEALLAKAEAQGRRDRTRLIIMCAGLVLVVVAYAVSTMQEKKHAVREDQVVGEEPEFSETIAVKQFDFAAVEDQILDTRPEDRVLLPTSLYEPVTRHVLNFNDAHFHALGLELATAEVRAALEANPSAHRGKALRVRGKLEEIKTRERPDGKTEYKGWLRGEDGELTHFIAMGTPDEVIYGDYMRFDGLFLKLYKAEDHDGGWAEAPLLIGSRLVRSYPRYAEDAFDPDVLKARLNAIRDDTAKRSTGLDGDVFEAQWLLMDYAKTEAYAAIDWDNAAVLDNDNMTEILQYGDTWRYRLAADGIEDPRAERDPETGQRPLLEEDLIPIPIKIPVSKNMGTNTFDPGENPSRLDTITTGWLGNWTWTNHAGVIKFVMPAHRPDLTNRKSAELLQGKGFFVKNHNYESKDHGTRTAPYFVLTELDIFTPKEDRLAEHIMWGVLGLTLFLLVLFPYLLMRDRKKSEALQRALVERRQARRRRVAAGGPQV